MLTLALDLGSTTGFAFCGHKHPGVSHGTISLKVDGKFHDSGYMKLFAWLEAIRANSLDMEVVVEKPHAGKFFYAVQILFGLLAVVHAFCEKHKIALREVSPMTIKKHWCGTGKADKKEMVKRTQQIFPLVTDHNESDSIALLNYHLETK